MKNFSHGLIVFFFLFVLLPVSAFPLPTISDRRSVAEEAGTDINRGEALKYKVIAIGTILIAGAIGVSLPMLGKIVPSFSPENDVFFIIKAFAAGVILSTGMVHILPDATDNLTDPRLGEDPWGFPFAGLVAMLAAIGTLMVDSFASAYYQRLHFGKTNAKEISDSCGLGGGGVGGGGDEELVIKVGHEEHHHHHHQGHVHLHTHATHGHAHGSTLLSSNDHDHQHQGLVSSSDLIRHRVVSQVN